MIKVFQKTTLFLFLALSLFSAIGESSEQTEKKYNLSIAAIFKNEARYFKEWIEYHRLVGVDHFYLYNNGSDDAFMEVLTPYIQKGLVSLIDWPDGLVPQEKASELYSWVHHTQVPAYEDACKRSAADTLWLAIIDIDEFMVPTSAPNMKELLNTYRDAPGVMLFWHIYGTSWIVSLPPQKLLIEILHRTALPNDNLNRKVVKSIVKPDLYKAFYWPPHVCLFHNDQQAVCLDKSEARLNHYINRTIDYLLHSKVKKKEHMDNRKLSTAEIQSWINMGNEREDTEKPIYRFIPELRQRMGFDREPSHPPLCSGLPHVKDYSRLRLKR